jgi:intein/homing endonuclease
VDTVNKKRQTDEIRRCARDPVYFFKTYVKVSHPLKGPVPFDTYGFQDDCVKAFLEHRFVIVNKSRQLGLSTLAAAYAAWLLLFHRNKEIIIMATKLQVAQNFIKKVKFCVKNLPKWLVLPKIEKDNDRSLVFGKPSNSRIEAIPTAADAGRSEALSLLIVDEAAHVDDFEELWKGLYPTLSCVVGGTKVLLSDGFHDIEELCVGHDVGDYFPLEGQIFGKNGFEPLSHGYVSPDSETLKITTRHGIQLEVTHEHPLWKLDPTTGGSMTKARDLRVGDHLRVQHSMGVFGNDNSLDHPTVKTITPELAYILGGYIAEGWMSGDPAYGVWISNADVEFRRAFLENTIVKPFHPTKNSQKMLCCSKELVTVFQAAGVDPKWKCDTKRVPAKIWRCTKDVQAAFLRGYFDGDGSATGGCACASSTSRGLISDLHQMLLNLGIIPKVIASDYEKAKKQIGVRFIAGNTKPLQSVRPSWGIHIPRSQSRRYLQEIGFAIKRKQDELAAGVERYENDERKQHKVPLTEGILSRLEAIRVGSGKSTAWFRANGSRLPEKGHLELSTKKRKRETVRYTSTETINRFARLLDGHGLISERDLSFLDEISGGQFYWDPIVSIERSTNKTYDFTVPGTHSFLQNSILGSNTGGRALIISTPKGVGNWFHKLWVDAESGTNEFHPISLPWQVHPERDQAWFDEQASNMSQKAVAQELLCVGGTSRIITKDGFKLAVDVCVGDEVLTHTGAFKRVVKKLKRLADPSNENVYSISTPLNRQTGIIITGNHPVFSRLGVRGSYGQPAFRALDDVLEHQRSFETACSHIALFPTLSRDEISNELDVIDLAELIEGSEYVDDQARYPRQWGSNKRFVNVDYDLGRLIGLWMSDGYANPNDRFGVGFGFHIDEYDTLLAFVERYLTNLGVRVRPSKSMYSNACRIETHNQFIVKLIRKFTNGHYANDKMLNWDAVSSTNINFIRGLLVGYFEGDGDHHPNRKLKVVSVHPELLYQVRTLLSLFGHYPRIGHWKHQPAYLEFDCVQGRRLDELLMGPKDQLLERKGSRTRLVDGFFYGTPKATKLSGEPIEVFNFEVEDDHTYVVDSIVVHNCDFLASGDTYFDAADIQWIGQIVRDPIRREGYDKNVWVWQDPIRDAQVKYIISADVGRGDGTDYSAFHVLCTTTGEIAAEFKGKIRPDHFAKLLIEYGKKYNNALICPEANTYGNHVVIELVNNKYPNIYFNNPKGVYLGDYVPPEMISDAGFDTQRDSRKKIIVKLEEVIRNKQIKIYSSRFWNELKTFVSMNDKPQALKNCNDDLIIALAIGVWLFDTDGVHSQFAEQLNQAMISGFGVSVNQFDNMAGSGNEVIPAWTGMVPYMGAPTGPANTSRLRPKRDDPSNIDWLWK